MRDVVQGLQPITILKTDEELKDANGVLPESSNTESDELENKKGPMSCLQHNKERVRKSMKVRFLNSDDNKHDIVENKLKKKYVGYYAKTYYPTYVNKAKGLFLRN